MVKGARLQEPHLQAGAVLPIGQMGKLRPVRVSGQADLEHRTSSSESPL